MGLQKKISAKEAKIALEAAAFQPGDRVEVLTDRDSRIGRVGTVEEIYFSMLERGRLRYLVSFGLRMYAQTYIEEELRSESRTAEKANGER